MTSAAELLDHLVDAGSFQCWDAAPDLGAGVSDVYRATLLRARQRSGRDESVTTGQATIAGTPVALILSNFEFLGGSIGVAAAERITEAIIRATRLRLPVVASPASGGTRMQEGTPAFVRMTDIAAALHRHKDAHLPYLVYLRHPTFGGAMASWGSLGQITLAEPGASVGFLGPKAVKAIVGQPLAPGVQQAGTLYDHGLVDAVVEPHLLRKTLSQLLGILTSTPHPTRPAASRDPEHCCSAGRGFTAWECVQATRAPGYPGLHDLLDVLCEDFYPLHGTGQGKVDRTVVFGIATVHGQPCMIIGQDRSHHAVGGHLGPAGLRQARRGIALAGQWQLPIITIVDTAGTELSADAEQGGLAQQIARCTEELGAHSRPTIGILLGQGAGGAALALLATQAVVALNCAWLSPLPPEGASAILHGTTNRTADVAGDQHIGACDLHEHSIVDHVISGNDGKPTTATLVDLAQKASTLLFGLLDSPGRL